MLSKKAFSSLLSMISAGRRKQLLYEGNQVNLMEELQTVRYLWWKERCCSLEHSCCHYVGHKCSLKGFAAAGRKDLLLSSDLPPGMIRRSFSSHPSAWWGVDGRGVSKIALILGCILSSARVHRRVSLFSWFHSLCCCLPYVSALPNAPQQTQHWPHLSGGHCSQLRCAEKQQGFWESQLADWHF